MEVTIRNNIIRIVKDYVKSQGIKDTAAHDWWHTYRVYKNAIKINEKEGGDVFVISMVALLHDVFDSKFCPDLNIKEEILKLLKNLNLINKINDLDLNNILHSIENLSFNKSGFSNVKLSKEGQIAQDADRLDAIGAIAIARAFAYGGMKGNLIYDPKQGIIEVTSEQQYQDKRRHSINHFYEKSLKLKDNLNTEFAKRTAEARHNFMEQYLEQFFKEWEGEDMNNK